MHASGNMRHIRTYSGPRFEFGGSLEVSLRTTLRVSQTGAAGFWCDCNQRVGPDEALRANPGPVEDGRAMPTRLRRRW